MDFSKVRLADFVRSSLRGTLPAPANGATDSSSADAGLPPRPSDVCARAPQYTIDFISLPSQVYLEPWKMESAQYDTLSGYSLVVREEGIYVWKAPGEKILFFPLPKDHSLMAKFVPPSLLHQSHEPGFVALDKASGVFYYWKAVSETAFDCDNFEADVPGLSSNPSGFRGRIPLNSEQVCLFECVHPFGFVATTSTDEVYFVNLTDELGRGLVKITKLRSKSAYFSQLALATTSRSDYIISVRGGRVLRGPQGEFRELFVLKKFGDLALWHISYGGNAQLVDDVRVGTLLHMQIDMLYPNSTNSLIVHDVASEAGAQASENCGVFHVLASFAPFRDLPTRYLLIFSTSHADPDFMPVYRIQSYEAPDLDALEEASLHISDGVLVVVSREKLTFVDSPTRSETRSVTSSRWEETLSFKDNCHVMGATDSYSSIYASTYNRKDLGVNVATRDGFLQCQFPLERAQKSTTLARLEQAVFQSDNFSPLDLTKWPQYCAIPENGAIDEMAVEIAQATTHFLPPELPDLGTHLELRARALKRMYTLTKEPRVRELAQSLTAAESLYSQYSSSSSEVHQSIDSVCRSLGSESVAQYFKSEILETPKLLTTLAQVNSKELNCMLLQSLLACNRNGMGLPQWAASKDSGLFQTLERTSLRASSDGDIELSATTLDLLCALAAVESPDGANNNNKIKTMLGDLGSSEKQPLAQARAIEIASKYRVYSVLAPLEITVWLQSGSNTNVVNHIAEFGDAYASAVFETCIKQGESSRLVTELAPHYPQLVDDYLNAHKLHNIAWTLQPRTFQSTVHLSLATREAENNHDRTVFASLYKLSAYFNNRQSEFEEAERVLKLSKAQESLETQFADQPEAEFDSAILKHGLPLLQSKLLDKNTAIDLLALAPAVFEELTSNLWLAFSLVDKHDLLRQRLLVQQLVCNTDWMSLREDPSGDVKETLFYHIYEISDAETQRKLLNFKDSLVDPEVEEVRSAYPWDSRGIVVKELKTIAARARDIAEKFNVAEEVARMS